MILPKHKFKKGQLVFTAYGDGTIHEPFYGWDGNDVVIEMYVVNVNGQLYWLPENRVYELQRNDHS